MSKPLGPILAGRLRDENGFELDKPNEDYRIERTRAGRHQRAQGAWSWCLVDNEGRDAVHGGLGSQYPASECVVAGCPLDIGRDDSINGYGGGLHLFPPAP